MIQPCSEFNGGLFEPPRKLGHGWVITSHIKLWMQLVILALIPVNLCWQTRLWWYRHIDIWRSHGSDPDRDLVSDMHDDVIKWKHFPRYWPFVRGIHRSPVNSPHKGQWRGALIFSLICVWINGWVNNSDAGDFRRYRAHYDAIVMACCIRFITARNSYRPVTSTQIWSGRNYIALHLMWSWLTLRPNMCVSRIKVAKMNDIRICIKGKDVLMCVTIINFAWTG